MPAQVISSSYGDGPTLTAAAAASCVPTYVPTTLPAGYWQIGRIWRITASGRISTAASTPGTARWDLRLGGTAVFDSLAIPLIVSMTTVPWWLEVLITCRSVGSSTSATLMGQGYWLSNAGVNTPAPATGPGPGGNTLPFNATPVVGGGFNSQSALTLDFFFTQTVGTGSMTMHQFMIEQLTP